MTQTLTAEELLRKIQQLEHDHHRLKAKIVVISDNKVNKSLVNLRERLYMNILQSMDQSVHVFDLNIRIIYWNRMAQNLFGYTVEEALGKSSDIIIGPYSEFATLVMQRAVKGETWSGQFPVRSKYREMFSVITTLTPFRDQNGKTIGVTCVCTDARQFHLPSTVDALAPAPSSHQPLQSAIVSKISNMASKVKMKMKTTNIMDHDSDVRPTPFSFGWPWLQEKTTSSTASLNVKSQQHESPCAIRETPGSSWSYSSCNPITLHIENSDVEISWDDLIIREQIGQGSRGTVYRAFLYGSVWFLAPFLANTNTSC